MTESNEPSLLAEDPTPVKKPAKRKSTAVKPKTPPAEVEAKATATSTAKATKTAAPRKTKSAAEKPAAAKKAPARKTTKKAAAAQEPELPIAEVEKTVGTEPAAPAVVASPSITPPAPPHVDEWRPSSSRNEAPPPAAAAPVDSAPAPVDPALSTIRQRPVYIPRHVAKQMEEQARASGDPNPVAPISVSASEAARIEALKVEPPRHDPQRQDPRPGRHERHERHDGRRDQRRQDPREDQYQSDPVGAPEVISGVPEELGEAEGIVEVSGKGFGFLRDPKRGFAQHPADVFVTPELCRSYGLRDGQWVKGETRRGNRGAQLFRITEINGDSPAAAATLPTFDELTVLSPMEMIRMETVPERYTTRVIDLMAPIGKGQRGLIVAPPRTGKTTLLQHIGDAVVKNHPDLKLIILLVDERPEEVTEIKRTVPTAEIMASSNDSDVKSHTRIAQLAIERAKRLVESGKDVFVLLDSITRVGRAFNNATAGGGRTMSGGIDARALEIPRKLFAAARNTEEAGSLTIIATALIDTGSRMDELIFQEFKGTGNMELVLDRKISDQRIYPAVDIFLSGTRREELLIPADDLHKISVIRRGLSGHKPMEAMERLLFFLHKFPTNALMLKSIPG